MEVRNESENDDNLPDGDPRRIEVKNAIQTARLSINTTTNADIPEEWENAIYGFANKTGIEISDAFWNVGNLKKSVLNFNPMLGGGTSYSGSEEEKERYESIRDLYWNVRELNEYRNYFGILDSFHLLKLAIANTGTSFDEDIDVKLTIEKGIYVKRSSLPIPGRDIINELLEIKFIENSYKMKMTDKVDSYSGYPVLMPKVNYRINDPFAFKSDDEEYNESIEKYSDEIEEVFCYEMFEKSEEDVLTFHIDYLKHNTIMAFPSFLIFRKVPGIIRYEISSKHIPNIISGELNVKE